VEGDPNARTAVRARSAAGVGSSLVTDVVNVSALHEECSYQGIGKERRLLVIEA
jgi:hypothetical protein